MDTARVHPLAEAWRVLRAGLARHANPRPLAHRGSRTSPECLRSSAGHFESHHSPCRHRIDPRRAADAIPPPPCHCDGRGNFAGHAPAAPRVAFRQTLGIPAPVLARHPALPRLPAAPGFPLPPALPPLLPIRLTV